MENELEKAFENKFFCPSRFAQEIEMLVQKHKDMNYIDAIVHFCELNSIDLNSVPKLISKPLKERLNTKHGVKLLEETSRAKLVF